MSLPHPLFKHMDQAAEAFTPEAPAGPKLTLSVTAAHPHFDKLREAAAISTSLASPLPDGAVMFNGLICPPEILRERQFSLLTEALGREVVSAAVGTVVQKQEEQRAALRAAGMSRASLDPQVQAMLAMEAANSGVLRNKFEADPGGMTEFMNRAEAQRGGKRALRSASTRAGDTA